MLIFKPPFSDAESKRQGHWIAVGYSEWMIWRVLRYDESTFAILISTINSDEEICYRSNIRSMRDYHQNIWTFGFFKSEIKIIVAGSSIMTIVNVFKKLTKECYFLRHSPQMFP